MMFMSKRLKTKLCKECSKEFSTPRSNQIYCTRKCAFERNTRVAREINIKKREQKDSRYANLSDGQKEAQRRKVLLYNARARPELYKRRFCDSLWLAKQLGWDIDDKK